MRGRNLVDLVERDVSVGKLGCLRGPCGDLHTRVTQFPFTPVRPRRWTLYLSTSRRFDKQRDWLYYHVTVRPRPSRL